MAATTTAQSHAAAVSHAAMVVRALKKLYPEVECALNYTSALELLVATILSAQCTDRRVNIVTATLFKKYRTAADYASAPLSELENEVKTTGFYRNKAKNIQACCRALVEQYDGQVPGDLESLVKLAGVGRKTANVVLGNWFGIASGVVVDTHVGRISQRLGLTRASDPVRIERDLVATLPQREWVDFSHRLIAHGRAICLARRPRCEQCQLVELCPRIGVAGRGGALVPDKQISGKQTSGKLAAGKSVPGKRAAGKSAATHSSLKKQTTKKAARPGKPLKKRASA